MSGPYTLYSDRLTARVDPDGARLRDLRLDGGPNLVLDVDDGVSPALRDAYAGAIVGPVANRVRGGRVPMGRRVYQMSCNENGVTALHSGPDGLDRQVWRVTDHRPARLALHVTLPDGHGGLPGTREIEAVYALESNALRLDILMTTDAPTPASIAHHPYWRVDPDHQLMIHADTYLPTDAENLPTGDIVHVGGTALDHRTPRPIATGTDHNFCVGATRRDAPADVAELRTGTHVLRIASTEPGLQAYSGAFLPDLPAASIGPLAGIALEPQGWPDAVNHPDFPDVIVTPDHPYVQITTYTLHHAT
ncbi:MAG: aldose epimerase family protein [Ruegeria sp.]